MCVCGGGLPLFFSFFFKFELTGSLLKQARLANSEDSQTNSSSLLASPTGLSPYLRFGCLSCRLVYMKFTDLYGEVRVASHKSWAFRDSHPFSVKQYFVTRKPMCVFIHAIRARRPEICPRTSWGCWWGSSSTRPPAITPTLTRWRATPCASRSPGTRTPRPWPSGLRVGRAFPG